VLKPHPRTLVVTEHLIGASPNQHTERKYGEGDNRTQLGRVTGAPAMCFENQGLMGAMYDLPLALAEALLGETTGTIGGLPQGNGVLI
jgi:hypothetical protein